MAERWTEQAIREIAREEIRARDTIPAPTDDSHSGAVVVPRGSSDAVVDIPGVCPRCRMLACVCGVEHE